MKSSWTRDRTHVPCIGTWIPIHCNTREVLTDGLIRRNLGPKIVSNNTHMQGEGCMRTRLEVGISGEASRETRTVNTLILNFQPSELQENKYIIFKKEHQWNCCREEPILTPWWIFFFDFTLCFYYFCYYEWMKSLGCVRLFATPQAPPSMGFSRQEYWSGKIIIIIIIKKEYWSGLLFEGSRVRGFLNFDTWAH